jgi:hypothetical protein
MQVWLQTMYVHYEYSWIRSVYASQDTFIFYGHPVSFLFDSPFPSPNKWSDQRFPRAEDIISYKDKALVYTATCLANKNTPEDIVDAPAG